VPSLSRRNLLLFAAVVAVSGCLNLFHPLLQGKWAGNVGDGRWNMYLVEHHYKVLTDSKYPGTYSTAPFWYPGNRNNLAFSDLMAGALPLYILPRSVLPRETAFQAFLILAALCNFAAFLLLLLEAGAAAPIAIAGAGVFAFGAHRVQMHLGYTQYALQAYGVLSIWCWLRFWRTRRPIYLFGLVLAAGLQTATGAYAGYLLVLALVIMTVVRCLVEPVERIELWHALRRGYFAWAGALACGAVVPAILLLPYLRTSGAALRREWWEVSLFFPSPLFWFQPLRQTLWWWLCRWTLGEPQWPESHFIGAAVWLAVIAGLWWFLRRAPSRNDARVRLAAVCTISELTLMLLVTRWWANAPTPWRLLYDFLPGANEMRDVRRLSLAANPLLLLAGSLVVTCAATRYTRRWWLWCVAALALAENVTPFAYQYDRDWYAEPSEEIRAALRGASSAAGFLDPALPDWAFNYNLQLIAQEMDVPLVNGASGHYIPGYPPIIRPGDVASKGQVLAFNGLVYLVPRAAEQELSRELRENGFTLRNSGQTFAVYTLHPRARGGAPVY